MDVNLNEVLIHARELRFSDKSEDELRQMLIVCGNYAGQVGDRFSTIQIEHAVTTIHEELSRRLCEKNHKQVIAGQQELHQKATEQGEKLHGKTMAELHVLKNSVDQLARARWIDWAILIVGAIAAVGVIISLFLIH